MRGGEARGFVTDAGSGVGRERKEERGGDRLEAFEGPERGEAAVGRGGAVGGQFFELGGDGGRAAVGEFEPGEAGDEGVGGAELGDEGAVVEFGEVGRRDARLVAVTDAPDAAAGFVPVGMRARDFVVRDNFVIPIHDVERAVGAEVHRDRAEPFVGGCEKIGKFFVAVAAGIGRGADGVNRVREGIGEEEDFGGGGGISRSNTAKKIVVIFGEGEAAEASAAHLRWCERRGHERLVGAEAVF